MKLSTFFKLFLAAFTIGCGVLIWQTGVFCRGGHPTKGSIVSLAATTEEKPAAGPVEAAQPQPQQAQMSASLPPLELSSVNAKEQTVTLGKVYDKCVRTDEPDKYKYEVELTSAGAAVRTARLSEFSDLDRKDPKPLSILSPIINNNGRMVYSLASESLFVARKGESFGDVAFPLDKLQWKLAEQTADKAVFVAEMSILEEKDGKSQLGKLMLRITRTYTVAPDSYDLVSDIKIENLSSEALRVQMNLSGAAGMPHGDMPGGGKSGGIGQGDIIKVFSAYQDVKGAVVSRFIDAASAKKAVDKNKPDDLKLDVPDAASQFAWAAMTNRYFAAIAYPSSDVSGRAMQFQTARYYPSRLASESKKGSCSFVLRAGAFELAAAGSETSAVNLGVNLYLGPKDKKTFENNAVYNKLQLFQTIDFASCCCPKGMIGPLAFGLVWLMNAMYYWMGPWGNYGVVIIILVFLVRLMLHPLTKMGQVRMMKSQKLMPKFQEMQKRLGKDKTKMDPEMMAMNKQMMQAQMMGMMPMFIQMPIWIAVWTAVSINFDLRGQGFFPFWMTDLSAPDAVFRFTPFLIPFVGWEVSSLNLLPILMGVVTYFQMKMTPTSATPASPEMAQQQKMMTWMMVGMFPIMLYNGPSGVNLYIMASMAAGVVEQYVIRKHLREKQELEEETFVPTTAKLGKVKKKKSKPMFKFDR